MKTRDVKWSKPWSHAAEVVKQHLEVNRIKFAQPYMHPGTFIFPTGTLEVETVNSITTYKFNGVEIKFNDIRDAVTNIVPSQKDLDEALKGLEDDLPF